MNSHKMKSLLFLISCLLVWGCEKKVEDSSDEGVTGTIKHHPNFSSAYVDARNIDIWLPPGYSQASAKKYPVLYMHDGQNLYDPKKSYIGVDWGIDETMARLIKENKAQEVIIVGIWNTPKRVPEYMPQKPLDVANTDKIKNDFIKQFGDPPISDNYLKLIVEELKPFVDSTYQTFSDVKNTFIMGSSMGGLISIYALLEYPDVFAGAGCISTHWPIADPAVIEYVKSKLPAPGHHKIYFDFGTETLDAQYEPYQKRVDEIMRAKGYNEGENWITRKFVGHEHSEKAWKKRVHIPLTFFFGESNRE